MVPRLIHRRQALAASLGTILAPSGCASVPLWTPRRQALDDPDSDSQWPDPDPPAKLDPEEVRRRLLALHNAARAEEHLPFLAESGKLQAAAVKHAAFMADRRKMTHAGLDGSSVLERLQAEGYRLRRCGENIAYGHYTPEHVMRGWLESRPHRKNILGGFSQIGIGYAIAATGTPYWCVTFGLPARPR